MSSQCFFVGEAGEMVFLYSKKELRKRVLHIRESQFCKLADTNVVSQYFAWSIFSFGKECVS